MTALVDADSLLYKVCCAIEDKVVWNELEVETQLEEENDTQYFTDIEQCFRTFDQLVANIQFATDCDDVFLVFTGSSNFRMDLGCSYKENRKALRKPLGYQEVIDYALENYPSTRVDYMEADDYVVYYKTSQPEDFILCAIDKDVLYQTEGTHYNYMTDEEVTITEFEAIKFAYWQVLVGDTADGYKGCPGIGKVKADKLLADCKTEEELWSIVVEAYEKKGLTIEDAICTMRLANMHQFDGDHIVYWNPPEASN